MNETKGSLGQADVYAGDTGSHGDTVPKPRAFYIYAICSDPDADAFGRIANLFNFANVPPQRVDLRTERDHRLTVSVEIGPIEESVAEAIRRKVAQLTCVVEVHVQMY
jgi:hypothetical protein